MKLLLIQPPFHNPAFAFAYSAEPLAFETIAGAARDCEVTLLDQRFDRTPIEEVLARLSPDVVGTGGYTVDVDNVVEILRAVKRHDPEIFTLVGGHHATMAPKDYNLPEVDAIALGLGEQTLQQILEVRRGKRELSDVDSIAVPRDGSLSFTNRRPLPSNLDGAPMPRRDLSAQHRSKFRMFGKPVALVNTARGCPYRCTFCSIITEMGGKYITKSPERVVREVQSVPQRWVRFADGNTFGNPKRMEAIAEILSSAGVSKEYMVDARSDTIVRNATLFERWRDIGLTYVAIGLESTSDSLLSSLNKGSTVDDNVEAIRILRQCGIKIIGQFMVSPDFEEKDFDALEEFVAHHRIHYPSFSIATPMPGTPLMEEKREVLTSNEVTKFDCMHAIVPTKLDEDLFYRRYMRLFERSYGAKRVAQSIAELISPRTRHVAASPLLLAAVFLQVKLSRKVLAREYGVE